MNEPIVLHTTTAEETQSVGEIIGSSLRPGAVIALFGELGAGKTTITKGIARGLGINDDIHSPTFNLLHIHDGTIPLYHFDVYRLQNSSDMDDLGYEEYFYGNGVSIIEWPEIISDILPEDRIDVNIEVDNNSRIIRIHSTGKTSSAILDTMRHKIP